MCLHAMLQSVCCLQTSSSEFGVCLVCVDGEERLKSSAWCLMHAWSSMAKISSSNSGSAGKHSYIVHVPAVQAAYNV